MRRDLIAQQLEIALRTSLPVPALRLIELKGERPAIDETREPWIPIKYGPASPDDWFGVVPATARFERDRGGAIETLDLVVKVNPRQGLARTLIPWIIEHKKIALDRPYWEYRSAAESDHTSAREERLYGLAASTPALRAVLPRLLRERHRPQDGRARAFSRVPRRGHRPRRQWRQDGLAGLRHR